MKIIACILLILVFPVPGNALSQTNDKKGKTVSVHIFAEVASAVKVITIQNIRFSETQINENIVEISPLRDANAGFMKASGKPNAQVRISFPRQNAIFSSADSSGSLTFNYRVAVNDTKEQASADLLLYDGKVFTLNNSGELYIWVGGLIDISNATPGVYSGSFKLEIEYI